MRIGIAGFMVLALGCASGARSGPMFEYGPVNAPLRYAVATHQTVAVETPMGDQESFDTVEATVAITIGGAAASGRSVTATFEALSARTRGAMGGRTVAGGDLIGRRLSGTLQRTGRIDIEGRPSLPSDLAETFDPVAFLVDLLAPMPAEGGTAAPWPVRIEATSQTAMRITGVYEGTARIAGDTTWGGEPAKIIVAEGTVNVSGRGTPSGAPAELHLQLTGTSTRRYVWDAARGVMLAAHTRDVATGTIDVQGMDLTLPAKTQTEQTVQLKR